jgi:hypothetical protein
MWPLSRGSGKYNVAPKADRTLDGRVFDSKREMHVAMEFEALRRNGDILEIEYQPVIELIPRPNRIKYVPDFRIVWRNGNEEYIDVKGVATATFNLKAKMFAHFHPDKKLIIMK